MNPVGTGPSMDPDRATKLRIVVVDANVPFRHDLMLYLQMLDEGYRVVGQAASVPETLACIELTSPDLVVTAADLPVYNGLIATHRILQRWPRMAIIMMGNHARVDYHQAALQAGTLDYIDKLDLIDQLPHTLAIAARAVVRDRCLPAPPAHRDR